MFPLKYGPRLADLQQTLYIYLGTAGLIGCITGAFVFIIFKFISSSLHLDAPVVPQPQPQPQDEGRTTAEFRAGQRLMKEEPVDHSLPSPPPTILKRVPGSRSKGLQASAIIEEEDSDF